MASLSCCTITIRIKRIQLVVVTLLILLVLISSVSSFHINSIVRPVSPKTNIEDWKQSLLVLNNYNLQRRKSFIVRQQRVETIQRRCSTQSSSYNRRLDIHSRTVLPRRRHRHHSCFCLQSTRTTSKSTTCNDNSSVVNEEVDDTNNASYPNSFTEPSSQSTTTTTTICRSTSSSFSTIYPINNDNNQKNKNSTIISTIGITNSTNNTTTNVDDGISKSFGRLVRIQLPGEKNDSFVNSVGVPTYRTENGADNLRWGGSTILSSSLSRNQQQSNNNEWDTYRCSAKYDIDPLNTICSPSFVVSNILSNEVCNDIIKTCFTKFQQFNVGKNNHGAMQIIISDEIAQSVATQLEPYINVTQVEERYYELQHGVQQQMKQSQRNNNQQLHFNSDTTNGDDDDMIPMLDTPKLEYVGINRRWRIYRYLPGTQETFAPHIDAGFPPSGLSSCNNEMIWDLSNGTIISHLTILFYLNDNFVNGETIFYYPNRIPLQQLAAVKPQTGSCLIFPQTVGEDAVEYTREHWPVHEGSPVAAKSTEPKYVIRSDLLFRQRIVSDCSFF